MSGNTVGEGRIFAENCFDGERITFLAPRLFVINFLNSSCSLAHSYSVVAGVALDTPTLLRVVLDADVPSEAPNTEIDVVILALWL